MKAPTVHPLLDLTVALPDGRRGRVLRVYEACPVASERCMIEVEGAAPIDRFTVKPSADLKVAR
ncbi:hypothetical protein [Bosea sp. (in: a-proteobacteria)]|uniref:hypothetical protein n=1 Tax=Bosea sp. (in: a-proteobacteria) TaxID=1871050 RepID=UPI003B3B6151